MEKSERETRDFMNVESFSQLPFIRPAVPVTNIKEKGIRLFGKEFGADSSAAADESAGSVETSNNNNNANASEEVVKETTSNDNNGESNRKFECHYCCRNFPTSQALGGHQNAHKRERQHAKRAHLQSAMVHGGLSEAHVYGFMNYHRLGSAPPVPPGHAMSYHPSWTGSSFGTSSVSNHNNAPTRFYSGSGGGAYSQPPPTINGSPLGLWRIPQVHSSSLRRHDVSSVGPVPLFSTDELNRPTSMMNVSSASQSQRFGFESKPAAAAANMQDHVSLDLRL